jgi:polar amino acid transport system substrate-binding protein
MKRLFFLFLSIYLFEVSNAKEVHLAVEDSWPPFALVDGTGISTNIVEAAFKEVGVKLKTSVFPYIRALDLTESGSVDGCYNVTKQYSTETKFIFGKVPLLHVKASFFYKKSSRFHFQKIEEFPEKYEIGVIRGYEYGNKFEELKKKFNIVEVNSQTQLIQMLLGDRIQTAIMFDKVADYYLKKLKLSNQVSKGFTNHESDIYVAFSRKNSSSKELSHFLDEVIKKLKKKKLYQKILDN